jgi:hypothetical protein
MHYTRIENGHEYGRFQASPVVHPGDSVVGKQSSWHEWRAFSPRTRLETGLFCSAGSSPSVVWSRCPPAAEIAGVSQFACHAASQAIGRRSISYFGRLRPAIALRGAPHRMGGKAPAWRRTRPKQRRPVAIGTACRPYRLYFTMQRKALNTSRQPIFLPSAYVRP